MSAAKSTNEAVTSLNVTLGAVEVGTIVRTPGDYNAFSFTENYRALREPPILSLSFRAADGRLRKDPKPEHGRLPAFFSNLLPEEKLREAMERYHAEAVRPGNDFDLLTALGGDLPGAVRATPSGGKAVSEATAKVATGKARFSLAGVQMKLSVMKNAGKEGGITLPVGNADGDYIAKFPSLNHLGLSENEFAMLALAEKLGMEVPERELVAQEEFEGIPPEFNTLATGRVLLVRRFDRTNAGRVHIEDFAQVFGVQPQLKYTAAGNHNIADALNRAVSLDAAIEFVRRLALAAATGNGDMHLKNWSVIYRVDGRTPQLAPVYDVLSTVAYLPNDSFALSLGGEKSFKGLTRDRWRNFANRARLPEGAVIKAVAETAVAIRDLWPKLPERDVVPKSILDVIDKHVAAMTPILDPVAVAESMSTR
jgi:serine/threonine-protein kinase HipA